MNNTLNKDQSSLKAKSDDFYFIYHLIGIGMNKSQY
jgi:hypothetical protein